VPPLTAEPPTPDVVVAEVAPPIPGEYRRGFRSLPTGPTGITETGTAPVIVPVVDPPSSGLAGWALTFAIAALLVSFVVGWGIPIGIGAAIAAILALRRPLESRPMAVWALVLALVSVVYSIGWLLWAAYLLNLIN
jgi:hypothetical protein